MRLHENLKLFKETIETIAKRLEKIKWTIKL